MRAHLRIADTPRIASLRSQERAESGSAPGQTLHRASYAGLPKPVKAPVVIHIAPTIVDTPVPDTYIFIMTTGGIKALKNDLSKHIRAAAAGETVLVTDSGKIVALIVPPPAADEAGTHAEREWAAMIREGVITPARIPFTAPLPERKPIMSFEEMMRDLDESREDR